MGDVVIVIRGCAYKFTFCDVDVPGLVSVESCCWLLVASASGLDLTGISTIEIRIALFRSCSSMFDFMSSLWPLLLCCLHDSRIGCQRIGYRAAKSFGTSTLRWSVSN